MCAEGWECTIFVQQTWFRLWLALAGVAFVAHTGHAINAAAPSVGAMLILVASLKDVSGKKNRLHADHVLQHDYVHNSAFKRLSMPKPSAKFRLAAMKTS